MTLLLEELMNSEAIWRNIARAEEPLFANMPVEHADPNPKHSRHWMFATDEQKILAHIYKPDYVLKQFRKVVVPLLGDVYGINPTKKELDLVAQRLVQDTLTYLFFHENFHPVFLPKSKDDREKFDVALKNGIKRAEPHLSPRDIMNKVGNSRNTMWDYFIDTFFYYFSRAGNRYGDHFDRLFAQRGETLGPHSVRTLPDGIITTWDIVEVANEPPKTLFYPITREMYALLSCGSEELRGRVFDYFRNTIKINDSELETAIVEALQGTVKYLDVHDLRRVGVDKNEFIDAAGQLYQFRADPKGTLAHPIVVKGITEIGTRTELRYPATEAIIEALAKYISTDKEEKRDGANTEGQESEGDEQTPTSQPGGGAEEALQSLLNQQDGDAEQFVTSIATDQSAPQNSRNIRLSNMARDEYYKRNARELPIKSPTREAVTREVGKQRIPVKVQELLLMPDQILDLNFPEIERFQTETGIQCFFQLSEHQYRLDIYEWKETPIVDFEYIKTGIILPDNLIFRVDGSSSMGTGNYVGSGSRYDCLMHVVYGVTKSVVKAAQEMGKEIDVVAVSYSNQGNTRVSDAVELQTFHNTPNNSAKIVLLNPEGGWTYHDLPAWQEAHKKCRPGKTLEIVVADGDLETPHDPSIAEVRKILGNPENTMAYFTIFHEGDFARRIKRLAQSMSNLTYRTFLNFDALQAAATGITIQYERAAERFGNR